MDEGTHDQLESILRTHWATESLFLHSCSCVVKPTAVDKALGSKAGSSQTAPLPFSLPTSVPPAVRTGTPFPQVITECHHVEAAISHYRPHIAFTTDPTEDNEAWGPLWAKLTAGTGSTSGGSSMPGARGAYVVLQENSPADYHLKLVLVPFENDLGRQALLGYFIQCPPECNLAVALGTKKETETGRVVLEVGPFAIDLIALLNSMAEKRCIRGTQRRGVRADMAWEWEQARARCPCERATGLPKTESNLTIEGGTHISEAATVPFNYVTSTVRWHEGRGGSGGAYVRVGEDAPGESCDGRGPCAAHGVCHRTPDVWQAIQQARQHGLQYKLVLRRTGYGWGVYAGQFIPQGAVLAEYTGELLMQKSQYKERDKVYIPTGTYYVFAAQSFSARVDPRGSKQPQPQSQSAAERTKQAPTSKAVVDATMIGNWTRFMNHGCDPCVEAFNMCCPESDAFRDSHTASSKKARRKSGGDDEAQKTSLEDHKVYIIAFRALRDINEGEQILFDYDAGHPSIRAHYERLCKAAREGQELSDDDTCFRWCDQEPQLLAGSKTKQVCLCGASRCRKHFAV